MPIGPPSHSPEPKSACIVFACPIASMVEAEPAATGSESTRWFHALSAGETVHPFAGGGGDPGAGAPAVGAWGVGATGGGGAGPLVVVSGWGALPPAPLPGGGAFR